MLLVDIGSSLSTLFVGGRLGIFLHRRYSINWKQRCMSARKALELTVDDELPMWRMETDVRKPNSYSSYLYGYIDAVRADGVRINLLELIDPYAAYTRWDKKQAEYQKVINDMNSPLQVDKLSHTS